MDISKIAELAKIDFSPEERVAMEADIDRMVALMDALRDAPIPENEYPCGRELSISMLRTDEVGESLDPKLLAAQYPGGGDFWLPRILE